jgi:DNA-directed RNA polymerase specialized sigma24 family protein
MREKVKNGPVKGIDAGLLKYASIIIENETRNDFKRMGRTEDLQFAVFNNAVSPDNYDEVIAYEGESENGKPRKRILRDSNSMDGYEAVECKSDVSSLLDKTDLSDEEREVLLSVDLMEMTIRQYAESKGHPVQRVHRIRSAALRKLRGGCLEDSIIQHCLNDVCDKYQCHPQDLFGSALLGAPVLARTDLFSSLFDRGMTITAISEYFSCSEEKIVAAINRQCLREMRK